MHRGDKNVHWGWDDTHRKSTGISGQGWEQGLHKLLLLPRRGRLEGALLSFKSSPFPYPSPLKEGEPRQRAQALPRSSQLLRASQQALGLPAPTERQTTWGLFLLQPRKGGSIRSRLTCVCFQKGGVMWILFLLLHRGLGVDVWHTCACECPRAPVCLNKGAGTLLKWSNSSNPLPPARHWSALQPFIVTNKIFMHFIYALMKFIINTINALTLL